MSHKNSTEGEELFERGIQRLCMNNPLRARVMVSSAVVETILVTTELEDLPLTFNAYFLVTGR